MQAACVCVCVSQYDMVDCGDDGGQHSSVKHNIFECVSECVDTDDARVNVCMVACPSVSSY